MSKSETKTALTRGVKVLAAAASLMILGVAGQASAAGSVILNSDSMDQQFQANISGEQVFSNGITFHAQNYVSGAAVGPSFDMFGFCVDVFHNITVGPLGYVYASNKNDPGNPLATDFGGNPILAAQLDKLTALVDTGYALHQQELDANNFDFDTEMQLAAIQAAIWTIEVPSKSVTVTHTGNLTDAQYGQYVDYYNDFVDGNYNSLSGPGDRIYVIADGDHQSFAIGWPAAAPEPASWALMLTGFFGTGALLRNRRKGLAAAV